MAKPHCRLWLGTEDSYITYTEAADAMAHALVSDSQASGLFKDEDSNETATFGDMDYMVQLVDSTAVISISGPMDNDYSPLNKYFGVVSYPEIRSAVAEAVNHPEVSAILLDIDSPGGAVNGLSELSDFIRNVDDNHVPIHTNTGATMASGGYWLGSVGRTITASELSSVGSIGVISVHREITGAMEKAGVNTTVIRKGKYKALANPYEKLTAEAKTGIEQEMDTIYDVFTRNVAENRGVTQQYIKDNAAEGKTFLGREAMDVGLVDRLGTFEDALATVAKISARQDTHNQAEVSDMKRKKRVLSTKDQAVLAAGGQVEPEAAAQEGSANVSNDGTTANVSGEASAEGEAAPGEVTEPKAAVEDTPSGDTAGGDSGDAGEAAAAPAAVEPDAVTVALMAQLAKANEELIELKVAAGQAKARDEAQTAEVAALTAVAVVATHRLQVATGSSATSLEGIGTQALVMQFDTLNTAFLTRFPVGASTQVPTESESQEPSVVSHLDAARSRATRI